MAPGITVAWEDPYKMEPVKLNSLLPGRGYSYLNSWGHHVPLATWGPSGTVAPLDTPGG